MKALPYLRLMRLHQPAGTLLLLWPCWEAVAVAAIGHPPLSVLALFAAGALLMRSAGCIINDLWDRKIDARVARTRLRPLASGEISPKQAFVLLALLLAPSLVIAAALGKHVIFWAAAALPLVIAYPLMKRITWWPQAFLGLTFNWGALLGTVAVLGRVTWSAWLLYAAGFFWTLGYDTIYALQDMEDDARIGVKSTARRFGARARSWIGAFYAACMLCLVTLGIVHHAPALFYTMLMLVVSQFTWQVITLETHSPASCRRLFFSNAWAGGLLYFACCTIS